MPNWSEGSLKIRGDAKKVERFVNEALHQYKRIVNGKKVAYVIVPKPHISINHDRESVWDYDFDLTSAADATDKDVFHIEGTSRAFVFTGSYTIYSYPDDVTVGVRFLFQQAWGISPDELEALSNKWDLDVKVSTTECGMQFVEQFEKLRGKPATYNSYSPEDWFWEVDDPYKGG